MATRGEKVMITFYIGYSIIYLVQKNEPSTFIGLGDMSPNLSSDGKYKMAEFFKMAEN